MSEISRRQHLPRLILTHAFTYAFSLIVYTISWFCLWNISRYLVSDLLLAGLFLPTGLKLAIYALSPRRLWPLFTIGEIGLIALMLPVISDDSTLYLLMLFSIFSHGLAIAFQPYWRRLDVYWKQLLALCCFAFAYANLCGIALLMVSKPMGMTIDYALEGAVSALTGGILLMPFFFLLYDYLHRQIWQPLSPTLVHQEITLRSSALVWCLAFFSIGLAAELTFLEEMKSLSLLLFLLPNIFMAYRYGWQGGVLASVMNSILLATARQISGSFDTDLELQSFIATQALIGLGLGIAISRQYLLSQQLKKANENLQAELHNKKQLAKQLVHVEEDIRKSVARELHDEIGQNITAIQIQSMLAKRLANSEQAETIADTTHELAMRIHTSTRQLLKQLRPQALDEMGLEAAIRQLATEMRFKERQVDFKLNFGILADRLDEVTAVTLYRIVQELLNNICKHAQASEVQLSLMPGSQFSLELRDNGVGLPDDWRSRGHGLRGIEERVHALSGQMTIRSNKLGCRITVNLPTKSDTT
ncbi:signal transduction histidine-protein kinase/phosphatase UhpB [Photobacterium gaetbulicola]|uniref:Hypoyhetical signal transduction histidine kinase n=1 Tax=Photobacterium gaetbulicola Gung47 TaxID=658445 RepID=A0A0C5WRI9_9GAMM|nr:signal transduction histidine-protein kinase/phosphatase UhpB [Photobacterium gaetbulicola]AJR08977.1 hypoyhetical signal transduction histidine kinase [Photobacterium gaetbulicola Gung47]PSU13534.1 signal transduction histidine-protein kinase/phosphatase UhpB [Photobacterium gaetbulicola]